MSIQSLAILDALSNVKVEDGRLWVKNSAGVGQVDKWKILDSFSNVGVEDGRLLVSMDGSGASYDNEIQRASLIFRFDLARTTAYRETTFTSDKLTGLDVWTNSGKTTKLFTQTLTYTGDDLTTVTIVDNQNTITLTKTLTYSGGNLDTITEAIT